MIDYKTLYAQTQRCSLLLVEDHEPLRNDIAVMLEDFFQTVVTASNGVEALECYDSYRKEHHAAFSIVVSDIQMPKMNGVDLCEALRERNKDQQIIILSAHTDSDYLLRLINLGIAQFINKPIELEKLFDAFSFVCRNMAKKEETMSQNRLLDLSENVFWDQEKNVLIRENKPVSLTRYEIILMQLLVEKSEQICTGDDIMCHFAFEGIDLSEQSIRNLVFRLRKKLPLCAIDSIYGMGYKLIPFR